MAGLSTRTVQTVEVDPFTGKIIRGGRDTPIFDKNGMELDAGNLPVIDLNGAGPIQGSKVNRGQWSEFQQMGDWPIDQTIPMNHTPPAVAAISPDAQLGSPPLAAYGETPGSLTPGEQAINDIVIGGGHQMQGPPPPPAGWKPMQWEDATPVGPAPGGDPWQGTRIPDQVLNGTPPQPGMVMGSPGVSAALVNRPPQGGPRKLSPAIHAALMAQQTDKKSSRPGGTFLEAQGIDTSRMTPGELANALWASME